jgi:hypothetical protein
MLVGLLRVRRQGDATGGRRGRDGDRGSSGKVLLDEHTAMIREAVNAIAAEMRSLRCPS